MIAHFDVDAFYASVEVRDDPSLRGKPIAVAGSSRRAVVLTASYEARPFGVRSALPLYQALQRCPQLVVVPPKMGKYRAVSREIFEIFRARGHPVEGLSMDEAFVDCGDVALEEAVEFARAIRAEVRQITQLTVSAGVASGKMVAKILSDSCKPDGLRALPRGGEAAFLAPLPVGRLWGVGPKTQERLRRRNITTIGEIAALDDTRAHALFGTWGRELRDLARGIDHRSVEPERETKSISSEETFEFDERNEAVLLDLLRVQAAEVAGNLRSEGLRAHTVGVKIKRADFSTVVRQTSLGEPTDDAQRIHEAAVFCLRRAQLAGRPVRLLGLRVASLVAVSAHQEELFSG